MLTPEEQAELDLLLKEENQAMKLKQDRMGLKPYSMPIEASQGLTEEEKRELELLEEEERQAQQFLANQQNPELDLELPEADLGFITRSKYAIEPLESNRRALLAKEFGDENVLEDDQGNIFLKQGKYFRPVNKAGFSGADIADIVGATPEIAGTAIGGLLGGGVGSIPTAIAGGAIGSVARQGISTLLGTPQVAGAKERGSEVALSGALSGLGAGAGKLLKGAGKKLASFLPDDKIDDAFKAVAEKTGVKPTKGQLLGGRPLEIEKTIQETPIFGTKIRKQVNKQVFDLKENLSKEFGDFKDLDFDKTTIGAELKDRLFTTIQSTKNRASDLFDEVSSLGKEIKASDKGVINSFVKNLDDIRILNKNGKPLKYNAYSGFTKDQFNKVQNVSLDIIDAIKQTAKKNGGFITANDVNTLRKTIDAEIKEAGKMGFDDIALLKMRERFLNLTETMLDQENKNLIGASGESLKSKFREARGLYKKYLDNRKLLEKDFKLIGEKSITDEKVIDRIFRDTKSLDKFSNLVDEKTLKLAGDNYIRNLLSKRLGRDGQLATKTAMNTIFEKSKQIKKSIGKDSYEKLIANLKYLDRIGEPINPSKTAITDLRTNLIKGALLRGKKFASESALPFVSKTLKNAPNPAYVVPFASEPYSRDLTFKNLFKNQTIPYQGEN